MIEKLMKKVANAQEFNLDDKLGHMVQEFANDELSEESLDLVSAAGKGDISYASFLKYAQERDRNRK